MNKNTKKVIEYTAVIGAGGIALFGIPENIRNFLAVCLFLILAAICADQIWKDAISTSDEENPVHSKSF